VGRSGRIENDLPCSSSRSAFSRLSSFSSLSETSKCSRCNNARCLESPGKAPPFTAGIKRNAPGSSRQPLFPYARASASGREKSKQRERERERERERGGKGKETNSEKHSGSPDFILPTSLGGPRHNARGVPRFLARRGHYERAKQRKSVSIIPAELHAVASHAH